MKTIINHSIVIALVAATVWVWWPLFYWPIEYVTSSRPTEVQVEEVLPPYRPTPTETCMYAIAFMDGQYHSPEGDTFYCI